jgi:hypothetical protein
MRIWRIIFEPPNNTRRTCLYFRAYGRGRMSYDNDMLTIDPKYGQIIDAEVGDLGPR